MMLVEAHASALFAAAATTAMVVAGAATILLRNPDMRLALDRRLLRAAWLGQFILQQETGRFARTLGTLVWAGVPLLQASTSARAVIRNRHVANAMDGAIDMIREGASLHHALQATSIMPAIAVRMISVGEEAGKLPAMLLRIATMFETQTQRSVDRFMTILTPALTVMIAVLVGGMILAVMNAILSINGLVGR